MSENNTAQLYKELLKPISGGRKLFLFIKAMVVVFLIWAIGGTVWQYYIVPWWNNSCPEGLQTIIVWAIFLIISAGVYKSYMDDEQKERNRKIIELENKGIEYQDDSTPNEK